MTVSIDEDLTRLRLWQGGDAQAGRELFERHFDGLYRFFWNKIEVGDIEDLVQQTLLACVQGHTRFRGDSSFRTYLFRIAQLTLYKRWEALRRSRGDVDFTAISLVDLGASPSELVVQRQEHRILLAALRRVPVDSQILLELYYWESLSGPELAEILDLPQGTVRSRLQRAKEQLLAAFRALSSGVITVETTVEVLDEWARRVHDRAALEYPALGDRKGPAHGQRRGGGAQPS